MSNSIFAGLLIGLLIAAILLVVLRDLVGRTLFIVRVDAHGARMKGAVPGLHPADLMDFVQSLAMPPGSRIRGFVSAQGHRLRFSRQVPEGSRQRFRNLLHVHGRKHISL